MPYCKWHNSFSHTTNDCNVLRKQIQSAIEQGRLILGQYKMRVDADPFPVVNMVDQVNCGEEAEHSVHRRLDFAFNINMANPAQRDSGKKEGADSGDRLHKDKKRHVTEDQVRSVRYQRPLSTHLLKKYRYQYEQRLQYESEGEEYKRRTGRNLRRQEVLVSEAYRLRSPGTYRTPSQ